MVFLRPADGFLLKKTVTCPRAHLCRKVNPFGRRPHLLTDWRLNSEFPSPQVGQRRVQFCLVSDRCPWVEPLPPAAVTCSEAAPWLPSPSWLCSLQHFQRFPRQTLPSSTSTQILASGCALGHLTYITHQSRNRVLVCYCNRLPQSQQLHTPPHSFRWSGRECSRAGRAALIGSSGGLSHACSHAQQGPGRQGRRLRFLFSCWPLTRGCFLLLRAAFCSLPHGPLRGRLADPSRSSGKGLYCFQTRISFLSKCGEILFFRRAHVIRGGQ